jgi:FkbM family methyltransferase
MRAAIAAMRALTTLLKLLRLRGPVLRWRINRARRRRLAAEAVGDDRRSHPALHEIDRTLNRIIDRDGGFFVEAGGNDGFTQSNTYWLERFRGWRGVLVEPMLELYELCREERPTAQVFRAALIPFDYDGSTVRMQFGDLMSSVAGTHGDDQNWVRPGLVLGWRDPYEAEVPARTLTSILDEVDAPEIDLLSLDVEGFEPSVLRGLDLSRHAPRYIVVEAHDLVDGRRAIETVLGDRYALVDQISPLDLLYRRADVQPTSNRS